MKNMGVKLKRGRPGEVVWAEVKYPYSKKDDRELSLRKHEKVKLIEQHDSGWWIGENMQGEVGFLPSNYVHILPDNKQGASSKAEIKWNKPKKSNVTDDFEEGTIFALDGEEDEEEEEEEEETKKKPNKSEMMEDLFGEAELDLSDGDISDGSVDLDELGDILAEDSIVPVKSNNTEKEHKKVEEPELDNQEYQQLKQRFEALQTEHESLQESFESYKESANEQAQKRSNLQTSILKKQIEKLKSEKDKLKFQYDEMKRVLKDNGGEEETVNNAQMNVLQTEVDSLKKEIEDYQTQVNGYKANIDALESERDDLTTKLSTNKAKLAAAIKTGGTSSGVGAAASSGIDEDKWNKTKKKLVDLATVVKNQKKKLEKHAQLAIAQKKKQNSLEATIKEQKLLITDLQKIATNEKEGASSAQSAQTEALKRDITTMKNKIAELNKNLEKEKAKVAAMEKDKIALQKQAATNNENELKKSSDQISSLQQQLDASKDEQKETIAKLKKQLEKEKEEAIKLIKEKSLQDSEMQANKAEKQMNLALNQAEKKIQTLAAEKEKISKQSSQALLQLKNKLEKKQATFDETKKKLAAAVQKLQEDLKTSKANHEKKDKVIAALKKRAESSTKMTAALIALRKKLRKTKTEQRNLATAAKASLNAFPSEFTDFKKGGIKPLIKTLTDATSKYKDEVKARKLIFNELQDLKGKIRIMVRVRPILPSDKSSKSCVSTKESMEVKISDSEHKKNHKYEFDHVFKPGTSQKKVFEEVSGLATSVLDGYNTCIFAYGQTGSGKTYTMEGSKSDRGINFRTVNEIFKLIGEREEYSYKLDVAVMEIYCNTLYDLLSSGRVPLTIQMAKNRSDVPDLKRVPVTSAEEVIHQFNEAQNNRSQASTDMNAHSSRSHCIVSLFVEGKNKISGVKIRGKLNLIDLAGSERIKLSNVEGQQLEEAKAINSSLSALGDVISSLGAKKSHIPFRNSKLTSVLQDSLGGHSKVMMFVNVSPVSDSVSETLCSLKFANRVKKVDLGKAKKNIV